MNAADSKMMHAKPMKFAWIGIALVVCGVLVALFAWRVFWLSPDRHLDVDNFNLIKIGMTQDEVERILGGPPGDYGENDGGIWALDRRNARRPEGSTVEIWFDDHHFFELCFDDAGKVVDVESRPYSREKPRFNWWQRFLRFLGS